MRELVRPATLFGLSLFLIVNVINSGIGNLIIQEVNAQSFIPDTPINPPTTVINNPLTSPSGAVINAQSALNTLQNIQANCNNNSQGTLIINKAFTTTNIVTLPNLSTLQFTLNVFQPGTPTSAPTLTQLSPLKLCINQGHFIVKEIGVPPLPAGFQFGWPPSYSLTGVNNPLITSACVGDILPGQIGTCTITNTLNGVSTLSSANNTALVLPGQNVTAPAQGGSRVIINAHAFVNSPSLTTPPTSQDQTNVPLNPPFQTCTANTATGTTANGDAVNTAKQIPSAMTIVIRGEVNLDQLRNQLATFKANTFSIVLKNDLNNNDRIMTAIASPRLEGEIIAQASDGARQKIFNFLLTDVRTECKFITLAKAIGPAPNANIAPLGTIGKLQGNQISAPSITKELIGGQQVGTQQVTGFLPLILNPPFASCVTTDSLKGITTFANGIQPSLDNLALYIIKGDTNKLASISGHTLTVQLTADLVPTDTDLAKIVNANNPYLVANLIANDNSNNAHQVAFTLTDVNTDCKQISLNTNQKFRPFPGELSP